MGSGTYVGSLLFRTHLEPFGALCYSFGAHLGPFGALFIWSPFGFLFNAVGLHLGPIFIHLGPWDPFRGRVGPSGPKRIKEVWMKSQAACSVLGLHVTG